ncbi:hypothetical protein BWQ96_02134 [Gracilariopsis chorda]|uniref:Uncharacterized protein n=1 Tax=Gracilariopsis chorda TaxID=448386 RepID=A0A2V3J190_9FLOR|nr:hypothetical protein BWQ96_02134 [Gracilariopsis chorda]|eukprot:PXF48182.1 hypothetical protein BWQ96_02134 [Gracilariopsis chorda]
MFTQEELMAEQFPIELMKFNNRLCKLFGEAFNRDDPAFTSKYMNKLQNGAI